MLGRFGNNLFQYATARVLAERHGVSVVMDGSWFDAKGWSQASCIQRLPIHAKVIRPVSLASRVVRKVTGKHYWEFLKIPIYREAGDDQSYHAEVLQMPADCLLMGYVQSSLYFRGIEDQLRKELSTDHLGWSETVCREAKRLCETPSVAVHVRRTDFTWLPFFAVCNAAYYQQAMNRMRARVPGAVFSIFSDDPDWCQVHLSGPDQIVMRVPGSERDPLIDFHLMSQAQHHIIANSSYSWWAAWLGKKPGQIVLCPPKWFTGGVHAPIGEKLCEGWEICDGGCEISGT